MNNLDIDKVIDLIKELKSGNFPVKSLYIDWKKFEYLEKLENGGAKMTEVIKPCIKVDYDTDQ